MCSTGYQVSAAGNEGFRYSKEHISYLISQAEKANRIPSGLLAAIARHESRTNPYALNINGKPLYNRSLEEASKVVKAELATGLRNIDIGVMQLNYRWHGGAFKNVSQMIIPENNINYAAALLRSLRNEHGNWFKAVRYYHSAKPEHYKKYSRKVVSAWLRRDRTGGKRTVDSG